MLQMDSKLHPPLLDWVRWTERKSWFMQNSPCRQAISQSLRSTNDFSTALSVAEHSLLIKDFPVPFFEKPTFFSELVEHCQYHGICRSFWDQQFHCYCIYAGFFVSWSSSSQCNDYFRQSPLFLPKDRMKIGTCPGVWIEAMAETRAWIFICVIP